MSNTVNRFGIDMNLWISYTEVQKKEFNRKYQLIFNKRYEILKEFDEDFRKKLEENFEKVASIVAKVVTE